MRQDVRNLRRFKRRNSNIIAMFVVIGLLLIAGIVVYLTLFGNAGNGEDQTTTSEEVADQKYFDFQLYEGETVDSAVARSDVAGTGFIYIDENGEYSVQGDGRIDVLEISGEAPKYTVKAYYLWKKSEGAEPMICLPTDQGMSDNPGDVAFYCEAESLSYQD